MKPQFVQSKPKKGKKKRPATGKQGKIFSNLDRENISPNMMQHIIAQSQQE